MEENAGQKNMASTTIGHTIVIRGKLKSAENLIVHGRIDAEISSEKSVMIANEGIVKAAVRAESLSVSGILVGDAKAESRMELSAGGRMVGDILSPEVVISDGAAFRGRIDMPTFDGPRSMAESLPAKPAAEPLKEPLNGASSNGASVRPPAVPIEAVAPAPVPAPPVAAADADLAAPAHEEPADSPDADGGDDDDSYGLLGLGRKNRRKRGRF